jgi:calcineurin-like phosphoesterase family protein
MQRQLAVGALTLLAAACSQPTSPPASSSGTPSASSTPINQSATPLDIAVIGDVPYGDAARVQLPSFVDAINADPKVRLVVHVGDIKSGSDLCSDAIFNYVSDQFKRFADPLVYAIGDNEWTDCHRANNGGFLPLERLAKVRELFFPTPGRTLGARNMGVEAQQGNPENQLWVQSRVTFAALHIIGSNNGLDPWTPPLDQPAAREAEVGARNAANIAWLEQTFEVARKQGSAGIVLFYQADLWHPDDRAAGASFTAHTDFVRRLAELAAGFDGPVLLVSGDSHGYRVDTGVPWFTLYGATPQTNVTQIIVDRSIEDDADWLRLHVDPLSSGVFSWEQVFVP